MLKLENKFKSSDGSIKYIFATASNNLIETVFFRLDNKTTHNYAFTLCISSQAGCALKCTFCATGRLGLQENLTSDQMIDQVKMVYDDLLRNGLICENELFHVALMGMGEPLHNYDEVCKFYLSYKSLPSCAIKISLSTVGLVPKILSLANVKNVNYDLFVSLHSPFNHERNKLIPINKKYPIEMLLEACDVYTKCKSGSIKISYMLIDGFNDTLEHANAFAKLLSHYNFMVQILIYNTIPDLTFKRPNYQKALDFENVLRSGNIDTHIVTSKGTDIMAGCGQLAGSKRVS